MVVVVGLVNFVRAGIGVVYYSFGFKVLIVGSYGIFVVSVGDDVDVVFVDGVIGSKGCIWLCIYYNGGCICIEVIYFFVSGNDVEGVGVCS